MKALVVLFAFTGPSAALAQDAVWQQHDRIVCIGLSRQECVAGKSDCSVTKSEAQWQIDFPTKTVRYLNADFSERIAALNDDSEGLSEAALLDSGRLLRFHHHDDEAEFDASMVETLTGETFALTSFHCRAAPDSE